MLATYSESGGSKAGAVLAATGWLSGGEGTLSLHSTVLCQTPKTGVFWQKTEFNDLFGFMSHVQS